MSKIQVGNSHSATSVDSWTLLDDRSQDEAPSSRKSSDLSLEIIEMTPEETERKTEDEEEKPIEKKREDSEEEGFLVFDEYFQEALHHDYEHAEKTLKKGKRKGRKFRTPTMGISVFITVLLGLTVFATICSTLSQTMAGRGPEEAVPIALNSPSKRSGGELLNRTIAREMEHVKFIKEMERIKNETCPKKRTVLPTLPPEPPTLPKVTPKVNKMKATGKSSWLTLKDLLLDTNLHAVISLIMTNIYLFNLLFDLAKKPAHKKATIKQIKQKFLKDLEKGRSSAELRRYLFKELPFWNLDSLERRPSRVVPMLPSPSRVMKTPTRATTMTVLNERKQDRLCSFTTQKSSLALVPVMSEEAGKSECQRRFEELDHYQKKFEELRQNQRYRVRLLKQKFKNEVSHIRDTEEEEEVRAEKISKTSQRFIKKLKFNRERYLLELKKVKELRQKVAENRKKEASTESYEVALAPIYNYSEKFKLIKEKFEKERDQLPKEWKF